MQKYAIAKKKIHGEKSKLMTQQMKNRGFVVAVSLATHFRDAAKLVELLQPNTWE